jgi:hypothetical protein
MSREHALIGRWVPEAAAKPGAGSGEGPYTEVEFLPAGKLKFTVHPGASAKPESLELEYRAEQDAIVTKQPGDPHEDRTKFQLGSDGSLILEHGGHKGRYVRSP